MAKSLAFEVDSVKSGKQACQNTRCILPLAHEGGCKPFTSEGVPKSSLPTDKSARKAIPLCTGVLDYFPNALAAVARVSVEGNNQHNPGEPLHWSWGKSSDHADCVIRHVMDRGRIDEDGVLHSAKAAWRALAMLEEELVAAGAPMPRGAR